MNTLETSTLPDAAPNCGAGTGGSNGLDRLVPLREVARAIGQCEREVWREISRGKLPRPVSGRPARLFESDVRNYLERLREGRNERKFKKIGVVV